MPAQRPRLLPAGGPAGAHPRRDHRDAAAPGHPRAGAALGRPAVGGPARTARLHADRDDPPGPAHPPARRPRPHPDHDLLARYGRPFDRRRLAYLCLVLASFQRSRVEISLADLVRAFTPTANAIDGLGFDPTVSAHKAAVVDVLDWLADRGALRLSDGSVEAWTADTERGDALYDIDHDICAALFRPARPVQHLTSAAGLLDSTFVSAKRGAQREAAAQRAARALVEYPVVYYAQVEPEVAEALRQTGVAENLARLTGLAVERRAEGVLLADAGGRFTDRPFPGRGGAVNRAAGLLLAKIADVLEDPDEAAARCRCPPRRTTSATCWPGSTPPSRWPAWSPSWPGPPRPRAPDEAERPRRSRPAARLLAAPFIADSGLRAMIDELYDELGAASFTVTWQHDPRGLLTAALSLPGRPAPAAPGPRRRARPAGRRPLPEHQAGAPGPARRGPAGPGLRRVSPMSDGSSPPGPA